MRPMNFVGQLW